MPARESVLLRLDVRRAGRRCVCKHNSKHVILKDELRFVVRDPGAATREYGYCATCALVMLDEAATRLSQLRADTS